MTIFLEHLGNLSNFVEPSAAAEGFTPRSVNRCQAEICWFHPYGFKSVFKYWVVLHNCELIRICFADAVYTERYMGTPSENSDSYKVSITQGNSIKD